MKLRQLILRNSGRIVLLLALAAANAAYLTQNFFGWVITLSFFLFVPGLLLLSCLTHGIRSKWEIASFSLGLSLLLMMAGGLALNSLHTFGLAHPLSTLNIFVTMDLITVVLLAANNKVDVPLPHVPLRATTEQVLTFLGLTVLPLLAVGGAFRLNNGASNILSMVLFAAIPLLFMVLICRRKLAALYPYAVVMFGLAVLLSTSLRGWYITGHDIQHEFKVFQATYANGLWSMNGYRGDPYNACLSLTILPAMLAKITTISTPYIYKAVFQAIFAFGLVPIYLLIKRLGSEWMALTGTLVFISFPPFLNDMPFLNRQEMAFVFLGLLMLLTFSAVRRRPKTIITLFTLLGLILSHYSSGYVTIALLAISWLFFKVMVFRHAGLKPFILPVLSLPILTVALLFTFLWNVQVTNTTSNLSSTVAQTIEGFWGHAYSQASSGVAYSIIAPKTRSPSEVLATNAGNAAAQVNYIPPAVLGLTKLGKTVSHFTNVESLNSLLRSFSAKILQVLLLVGIVIYYFRHRKQKDAKHTYFYALTLSCLVALILVTLVPKLSVDYSVTRMFQQTLIITALPIVCAAQLVLSVFGKFKRYPVALFFALLFLDLSGFVPQVLGGYPPQLALNNAGVYYDLYLTHRGETISYAWLAAQSNGEKVTIDSYAKGRLTATNINAWLVDPLSSQAMVSKYVYQDYSNIHSGAYGVFANGDVIEYAYPSLIQSTDTVYVNQSSQINERVSTTATRTQIK